MNQDSLTPDATDDADQPVSTLGSIAQAVLALGLATAVIDTLPIAIVAAWLVANVVLTGLRARLSRAFPLWLASGLAWGLGTVAGLQAGMATPAGTAALLAAALAPLLAVAGAAPGSRQIAVFTALAVLPGAGMSLLAGTVPGAALALMLLLAGAAALSVQRERATLIASVASLQSTQRVREQAFERLDDEVQRLRVETRAVGESKESLAGELSNATQELAVLRSKAGALSNVLQRINPYDTETGLLTAEKFSNVMNREWARMRRQELPLSLLLVSIDKFDEFRERQGRLGYEAALRRISDVLRHAGNRPGDVAARLGPGAFALLFPETEHKHVSRLADSVRQRVRQLGLGFGADEPGKMLTATVGMATVIPNNEMTPETLRERVEAALYEAQFQGGDRSVRYRTMDSIRVEHWDAEQEGQLTADSVRHKLAVLGYDATPKMYKPGEQAPSRRVPVDSVEAVVEGQLKIVLEGEARVLKPGDLLFIPKGLVTSVEVIGQRPVLCLEAIRA